MSLLLLSPKPRQPLVRETKFINIITSKDELFPTFNIPCTVDLSIIIPAFNEESRIGKMLEEALEYLSERMKSSPKFKFEILIVDDCSKDNTFDYCIKYGKQFLKAFNKNCDFRVMKLSKNRGKGGAVTQGILASQGHKILFADADGASKFSDLVKLESEISRLGKRSIAIGSRAHMVSTEAVVKRSFIRNVLMRGFHSILYLLGIQSIKDTQCGFKMFTRESAECIFKNMHVEGWIFDIEVLLLAGMYNIPVSEVGIEWKEVEGTKLNLLKDALIMLKDLVVIRCCYALGIWKLKDKIE